MNSTKHLLSDAQLVPPPGELCSKYYVMLDSGPMDHVMKTWCNPSTITEEPSHGHRHI